MFDGSKYLEILRKTSDTDIGVYLGIKVGQKVKPIYGTGLKLCLHGSLHPVMDWNGLSWIEMEMG